ncbi:hypothetical protein [Escherichia fergusonii]|uniref:hypothetical protein n=1 Tax=Escherichia fergusonii TaxID=564 RepID=UPI0015F364A3|nr:hypothetical protein [Escherichia fergusonii]EGM8047007.1 hypothetical protein [Escherichia coli]MBA5617271.1 hypothetical protein [Escherichia fergusonii]MBA5665758.1 hypothetical protein [Escherichia fergusonii]MBA8159829.1 hypothetical protein [Escherichia fergusonii]MBA8173696.1 hypothetical protein [Escherichia fergusonii]
MISYGYINSVFASNLTLLSSTNLSSTAATQAAPNVSHGSITLAGDDDYCGADNVIGRRAITSTITGAITAFQQYQRFINDTEFSGMHPYGTSSTVVNWNGDGRTTNDIGYQGGLTGGNADIDPRRKVCIHGHLGRRLFILTLPDVHAGRTCEESKVVLFGKSQKAKTKKEWLFKIKFMAEGWLLLYFHCPIANYIMARTILRHFPAICCLR